MMQTRERERREKTFKKTPKINGKFVWRMCRCWRWAGQRRKGRWLVCRSKITRPANASDVTATWCQGRSRTLAVHLLRCCITMTRATTTATKANHRVVTMRTTKRAKRRRIRKANNNMVVMTILLFFNWVVLPRLTRPIPALYYSSSRVTKKKIRRRRRSDDLAALHSPAAHLIPIQRTWTTQSKYIPSI